jgi:ankyrin repeat protein
VVLLVSQLDHFLFEVPLHSLTPHSQGQTALLRAAASGHLDVVAALLQADADVNNRDVTGSTALLWAAKQGHLNVVKALLQARSDVNAQDAVGGTPICWAAGNGHAGVVQSLVQDGADVNMGNGKSPLSWAAGKGALDVTRVLLQARADVNSKDGEDQTPLMASASKGHLAVLEALLQANAQPWAQDASGHTALHQACFCGHLDVVRKLLSLSDTEVGSEIVSGAGESALSNNKRGPQQGMRPELVELFRLASNLLGSQSLNEPAEMPASDALPTLTLSQAARQGHVDTVKELLVGKADVNQRLFVVALLS